MIQYYESPIGLLKIIADNRKLRGLELVEERTTEECSNHVTEAVKVQLEEYFSGKRTGFTTIFMLCGTEFQRLVWSKLLEIPYGKVVTYRQLASAIGTPLACRAVAKAVGQNPYLIVVPCHRVIGSKDMVEFSGGLEAKKKLLTLEGVNLSDFSENSQKFLFTFD